MQRAETSPSGARWAPSGQVRGVAGGGPVGCRPQLGLEEKVPDDQEQQAKAEQGKELSYGREDQAGE